MGVNIAGVSFETTVAFGGIKGNGYRIARSGEFGIGCNLCLGCDQKPE
jgi:hypothetical protein